MHTSASSPTASPPREPAWEVARLFPEQGNWSEEEYFSLPGNRLVEYSHGYVEVLSMPSIAHQRTARAVYKLLDAHVSARGLGEVFFAPTRVRVSPGKFREPDVFFIAKEHASRIQKDYCETANLTVEIVSDDDRRRDLETKRFEYARAGIPEYWIVDPQKQEVMVLKLAGDRYDVHGVFGLGAWATSATLEGWGLPVDALFTTG